MKLTLKFKLLSAKFQSKTYVLETGGKIKQSPRLHGRDGRSIRV